MFLFSTTLLFLFLVTCSPEKKGDFGKLNACITENNSLMLECEYPPCPESPSFDCDFFTTEDGVLLGSSYKNFQMTNYSTFHITAKGRCQLILIGHALTHSNKTKSYNCTLIRRGREERKNITINYMNPHKKQHIKPCSTMGWMLHQAPTLLWPVVFMSLWKILS